MTNFRIPPELTFLARLFRETGRTLYSVGGMVRNALMGLPRSDIDVASAMPPAQVLALCEAHGISCFVKSLDFGTVEIHLMTKAGKLPVEHTTFRSERYRTGGSHRPEEVRLHTVLEEDAFRRDFSVNAIYYDILSGRLIDPTGGLHDLEQGILRTTTPDPKDILLADGLRILRLIRFAGELGLTVEENTFATAKAHVQLLNDIAWERKRDELMKILRCDEKYGKKDVLLPALYRLDALGAMELLIPELTRGRVIRQTPKYHAYNVLEHSYHACACAPPHLRLAALLHDVGKPETFFQSGASLDAGINWRAAGLKKSPMLGHDLVGAEIALAIAERMRLSHADAQHIADLVRYHMYDIDGSAKESTLRAFFAERGLPLSLELCDIREADVRGSGLTLDYTATRWRKLLQTMQEEGAPFSENDLQCTGEDIMRWLGIAPGKEVGRLKQQLLRHCAQHPKDNHPKRLKSVCRSYL